MSTKALHHCIDERTGKRRVLTPDQMRRERLDCRCLDDCPACAEWRDRQRRFYANLRAAN